MYTSLPGEAPDESDVTAAHVGSIPTAPGMDTAEFLATVCPSQGAVTVATINDGVVRHAWMDDTVKLANAACRLDGAGHNVYHGCAAYLTAGSRKADNVGWVRSLWLDVDAGPGKDFADLKAAILAERAFCGDAGLPAPLEIRSGRGLHAYWPMDRDLTPGEWLPLAKALKVACRDHDFPADPSRTADIASILRPIGTTNRKGDPIKVKLISLGDRPTVEAMAKALAPYSGPDGAGIGPAPMHIETGINGDLTGGLDHPWFDRLTGPQKDACLAEMLNAVRDVSDAGRDAWVRIVAACARSGAPSARDLCRDWSRLSPKYEPHSFQTTFDSFGG